MGIYSRGPGRDILEVMIELKQERRGLSLAPCEAIVTTDNARKGSDRQNKR